MCEQCKAGKFGTGGLVANQPECHSCMPGRYTHKNGQSNCTACPPGTWMSHKGAPACWRCPPGHFQPQNGHAACYRCPVGKFQPDHGSTECSGLCNQCDKGKYGTTVELAQTNSTGCHCAACPEGKYTPKGHTKCHDCPAGRFIHEKGLAYCHYCPPGSFSMKGQSNCTSCGFEKYQPEKGQVSCLACPKGKYQHMMRQAECSETAAHRGQIDPKYNHPEPHTIKHDEF